jgi:hypothetical protein
MQVGAGRLFGGRPRSPGDLDGAAATLPVLYRADPNTAFTNLRRSIQITTKAGYPEEAKGMIQDGAAFAGVNALDGLK